MKTWTYKFILFDRTVKNCWERNG